MRHFYSKMEKQTQGVYSPDFSLRYRFVRKDRADGMINTAALPFSKECDVVPRRCIDSIVVWSSRTLSSNGRDRVKCCGEIVNRKNTQKTQTFGLRLS